MTFYTFIQRYAGDQTAFGDTVRDIVEDKKFPRRATKFETLENYLFFKSSPLFMSTFERMYEHYAKLGRDIV
ncbi:YozE family protein [Kurthia gibsonii]|uniref:YozE family protein n=1 Tax=Kurthia gibsonii TaxID=33946 RepID=UPI0030D31C12